jgi:hypothetical protein
VKGSSVTNSRSFAASRQSDASASVSSGSGAVVSGSSSSTTNNDHPNALQLPGWQGPDSLRIRFWNRILEEIEIQRLLNNDMIFSACSVIFVFVWIFVHTGSFFLAMMTMMHVLLSLAMALVIYRKVFGITYFTQLHGSGIYLVLLAPEWALRNLGRI